MNDTESKHSTAESFARNFLPPVERFLHEETQRGRNPTNGLITIEWLNQFSKATSAIKFFDITGRLCKVVNFVSTESKIDISVDDLQTGLYFYNVINDGQVKQSGKLIKQ